MSHAQLRDAFIVHGSPDTVARKILELREAVGDFGTLMMTGHDWEDKDVMKRSMELMATKVTPAVNERLGVGT